MNKMSALKAKNARHNFYLANLDVVFVNQSIRLKDWPQNTHEIL
jgi:hypothetical protein